ncbi:MAG: hypothetical protein ABI273_00590 [Lacunisphaera sp.]
MKNEITAPLASVAPIASTHLPVTPRILRRNPLAHLMGKPDERVTTNGILVRDKMELAGSVLSNAA